MSNTRKMSYLIAVTLCTACICDKAAFQSAQFCADDVAQDLVVHQTTTVLRLSEAAADSLDGTSGLVRLFPDAGEFEERHRAAGLHRWFVVDEALGTKATEFVASLDGVELVEEVGEMEVCSAGIPFNDPEAWHQWHLRNDGSLLSGFRKGADINVVPVWENFTAGSREVIVAVLDSGADPTHPDLKDVIVPEGPDGSRNFIKDFSSTPYKLYPERHGTHTSSIIAAANNNAYGCCGIAGGSDGTGGVRILSLQTIADGHSGGNSADAFVWAADHGAVIASNSWNYAYDTEDKVPSQASASIRTAIDYFIQYAGYPVPVCTEFTVTPGDASLMFRWKVQAQGTEAVDSYVCYVGENQEEIEHLDPYDVPESVISVTTSTAGKAIGSTATDPDGDPLTITTDPGSVAVASWSDLGRGKMRLTIKGDAKRAGDYKARISASDGLEGEASLDIKYTLLPNNAPKRTGIIDRMALLIGGEPVRINLSEYFSDDDGEALRFDAYSSSNMLRTSTDGSYLTISGVDTGISIVTVTATDGANAKISMSFDVLSQESEICLYPIPVTKELNIRSLTPCEGNLTILGPSGNTITSHEFSSAPFAPCVEDMTGLGAGVYKVIIESGGSKTEKTVVKI